jgi:flagellar hook-associated protein 2
MQQARMKSNDRIVALRQVESRVLTLQGSLQALKDGVQDGSYQTSSSDTSIVRASSSAGAAEASYTLQVTSLGSFSTAVSSNTAADPASGNFIDPSIDKITLRIYSHDENDSEADADLTTEMEISLTDHTLNGVAEAIKAAAGDKIQTSLVNIGSNAAPSYALSLQSKDLGMLGIQIAAGAKDDALAPELMNVDETTWGAAGMGRLASYTINGASVKTESRNITIAPNVTAELLKAEIGRDITVLVSRGTSAFTKAAESFISAFNGVLTEVEKNTGAGGALAGDSLAGGVVHALRNTATSVLPGNAIQTLAQLGIEFDRNGRLLLNRTQFDAQVEKHGFEALQTFVGSAETGGILKTLSDGLSQVEKTSASGLRSGFLYDSIETLNAALTSEDARIAAEQARIEERTKDLQARLAAADAAIAALEQQASYFTDMFESMRANQKSYS